MPTLQELFPELYGSPAQTLGQNKPGFATTVKRSLYQSAGGLGEILADTDAGETHPIQEFARQGVQRNPSGINSFSDIAENPWLAVKEGAGMGVGFLGPQAAMRGVGLGLQGIGVARGIGAARVVGAGMANPWVGGVGVAALPSVYGIGEAQRETGEVNLLAKYAGGLATGVIEQLGGPQRLLRGGVDDSSRMLAGMTREQLGEMASTPLRTFGLGVARMGAQEAGEEMLQNPIEQLASGKDPLSSESLYETGLGMTMGAIGGAVPFGMASGARRAMQQGDARSFMADPGLGFRNTGEAAYMQAHFAGQDPVAAERRAIEQYIRDTMITQGEVDLMKGYAALDTLGADNDELLDNVINPFDVGGQVSALQQGGETDPAMQQLGLFGGGGAQPYMPPESATGAYGPLPAGEPMQAFPHSGQAMPPETGVESPLSRAAAVMNAVARGANVIETDRQWAEQTLQQQLGPQRFADFVQSLQTRKQPLPSKAQVGGGKAAPFQGQKPVAVQVPPFVQAYKDAGGIYSPVQKQLERAQTPEQALEVIRDRLENQNTISQKVLHALEELHKKLSGETFTQYLRRREAEEKAKQQIDPRAPGPVTITKGDTDGVRQIPPAGAPAAPAVGQPVQQVQAQAGAEGARPGVQSAEEPGQAEQVEKEKGFVAKALINEMPEGDRELAMLVMEHGTNWALIGQKLGISKQAVMDRVKGRAGKTRGIVGRLKVIADQLGVDLPELFAQDARKEVEQHDEDRRGLSPDEQVAVVDPRSLGGSEEGADLQTMGTASSVGGGQGQVEDAAQTEQLEAVEAAIEEGDTDGLAASVWDAAAHHWSAQGEKIKSWDQLVETERGRQTQTEFIDSFKKAQEITKENIRDAKVMGAFRKLVKQVYYSQGRAFEEGEIKNEGVQWGLRDLQKSGYFGALDYFTNIAVSKSMPEHSNAMVGRRDDGTWRLLWNERVLASGSASHVAFILRHEVAHVVDTELGGYSQSEWFRELVAPAQELFKRQWGGGFLSYPFEGYPFEGLGPMEPEVFRMELFAQLYSLWTATMPSGRLGRDLMQRDFPEAAAFFREVDAHAQEALRNRSEGRAEGRDGARGITGSREALRRAAADDATLQHAAFHGTPHNVHEQGGFSLQKIGTGEGALGFGWGLYFSSAKKVAEWYRRKLVADGLGQVPRREVKGRVYEVELAPQLDEYLDWDKSLEQQSPKVRAALRKVRGNEFWDDADNAATIYHSLAKELGGAKEGYPSWVTGPNLEAASKALLAAGIPGIKYRDGATRHRQGDGSYNFVIFDDKLVKIKSWESRGRSFEEGKAFTPEGHEQFASAIDTVAAAVQSKDPERVRNALAKLIPISMTPVPLRAVLAEDGSKPFRKSDYVLGQGSSLYLKAIDEHQASTHKFRVPVDVLKRLPQLIADPVAIYKSSDASSDPDSYKVVLDAEVDGRPIIAALKPNKPQRELQGAKAHFTATVFPLGNGWRQLSEWNDDGLLRYYDDKRQPAVGPGTNPQGVAGQRGTEPNWSIGVAKAPVKVTTKTDIMFTPKERWSQGKSFEETMPYPAELRPSQKLIVDAVKDTVVNWAKKGLNAVVFSHDLADIAVKEGLRTAKGFFDLVNAKGAKRIRLEAELDRIMTEAADLPDRTAVNKFLQASTRSQVWGYAPTWNPNVQVDPSMAAQYDRLSPEGKRVVDQVFKYGNDTYNETQRLVNQEINDEFDTQLQKAATADERDAIEEDRAKKLRVAGRVLPKLQGPYAPLKRFGDYVAIGKSRAYLDAEKEAEVTGNRAKLEDLQADPNHYLVEFHDTMWEAKARKRQLAPFFAYTDGFEKQKLYKDIQELPWGAIARVKSAVEESPDTPAKSAMNRLLTDLYLTMLSESSARKVELKRRGVHGEERDMLRSFASQGRASAHFIAALEHNGEIQKQIRDMQNEARDGKHGTREDRSRVFNEIIARYAQGIDWRPTPISDKLMRVTSIWMLLTSPAYYLQNSTQPFMLTLPVLSGRYGNGAAWASLTKAYKDVGRFIGSVGHTLDIDKLPLPEDERAMLIQLRNSGRIDITMAQDLGRWTEGESVFERGPLGKVLRTIGGMTQRVEMVNRITSALAAYRLSKGSLEYTARIVDQTHGNYAASNAPRFMHANGALRLITQFRKFQLIQISLLARLTKDAFKGASPQERAVARRALGWVLGHHMVMAGALGLPVANVAGLVLALAFGDDDEPLDAERMARKAIGDEDTANLILRGVPAALGLDVSQRIGMGNAFAILPFTDINLTDRKGLAQTMMGAGGPFIGGLLPRVADGIGYIRKGDYYKGLESTLPKGLGDALKAYRFATEGVTQKNNDMLLKPSEVDMFDVMSQAVGLPSTHLTARQRRTGDVIESQEYYKDRVSTMKHKYSAAYKENDAETMQETREEWLRVMEAMRRNGLKPTPLSTLLKAPREQGKREKDVIEGVAARRGTQQFVRANAAL